MGRESPGPGGSAVALTTTLGGVCVCAQAGTPSGEQEEDPGRWSIGRGAPGGPAGRRAIKTKGYGLIKISVVVVGFGFVVGVVWCCVVWCE